MTELPRSIFIPERNKNGAFFVDILIDLMQKDNVDPFARIFNHFVNDYNESTPNFSSIDLGNGANRKQFGFKTTASSGSRELLYGQVLLSMLSYAQDHMFDKDLIDEVKALRVFNGRIDHPDGGHDDSVIAWLLTGYFALYAKNHHMYGIPRGEILKSIDITGNVTDPYLQEHQREMQDRIETLKDLINNTPNLMMKSAFERELRALTSQLGDSAIVKEARVVDQVRHNPDKPPRTVFDLSPDLLRRFF